MGEVSLIVVGFVGVDDDRREWSTGTDETGDFALEGVFAVVIEGECSIVSNCSRKEATPLLVDLGDKGVGDWSRIIAEGDWERVCKTGVRWDVFGIVPLDGVVAVEVRLGRTFADGDDGKGSDLANWGGETFPPDT